MSDKLARAQHTRVSLSKETPKRHVGGRHAGIDRTRSTDREEAEDLSARYQPEPLPTPAAIADPGSTAEIPIIGHHVGIDRTRSESASTPPVHTPTAGATSTAKTARPAAVDPGSTAEIVIVGKHTGEDRTRIHPEQQSSKDDAASIGTSAAIISVCTLISRVLGFARTWVMAFALGSTLLASSYTVANTVPNMLFELAAGGMIVTAFLPVYVSVKKQMGQQASNEYASNLLTIVVVFLGIISAFCIAFPSLIIYTQSFYSEQSSMTTAVFFFQFFAIQIVFYGASSIVQGLLNANRDYLWSSIAPAANSVIVIVTFLLYTVLAPQNPELALYVIAIGNPLGVFAQLAIQLPALKRNGIRLRPRIKLHDPALRETLGIGAPAVFVMLCSSVVLSVQTAAAYSFADNGPSLIAYARLWFTLPYSFLAVPITTAMFTELSTMQAEGDEAGVKRGIVSGTNQILFFMIPFALYLMTFSLPLVTLYNAGAFTMDNVSSVALYLSVLAFALPVYGVNTYLQKTFSSLRKMGVFALFNFIAGAAQIGVTMFGAAHVDRFPIEIIAVAEVMFYVIADLCLFIYLRKHLGPFGLRSTLKACLSGIVFGGLGAAAGGAVLYALQTFVAPLSGSIIQALLYVIAGGVVSLAVTFGLSIKLRIPEAAFVSSIAGKVRDRLRRN